MGCFSVPVAVFNEIVNHLHAGIAIGGIQKIKVLSCCNVNCFHHCAALDLCCSQLSLCLSSCSRSCIPASSTHRILMFLVGLMLLRLTELMQISGTRSGLRQVLLVQVYSSRSRDPLRSGVSMRLEDLGGGSSR